MPIDAPYKYETGVKLTLPIPTKDHHEFLGWYLDDTYLTEALFELPDTISGSKTLYAKWVDIAEYKNIIYNTDEGILPDNAVTKYIPGKTYELSAAKKDGYFFRGWYDNRQFKGDKYSFIDETFNVIKEMLLKDNYIVIQGLGVFYTDYLDETDIKDPRNDKFIHFSRRRVPRFYFSRSFKKQIRK